MRVLRIDSTKSEKREAVCANFTAFCFLFEVPDVLPHCILPIHKGPFQFPVMNRLVNAHNDNQFHEFSH